MRFDVEGATSVELCTADWVAGSRFRDTTTVVAEVSEAEPLLAVDMLRLKPAKRLRAWRGAIDIAMSSLRRSIDIIVVQQTVGYAGAIASLSRRIPMILQNHNFVSGRQANPTLSHQLRRLSGMTLISQVTLEDFETNWPEFNCPRAVISNGFDFSRWHPAPFREKLILATGRVQREKGLIEAADGTGRFLANHPDWRATFVLSSVEGCEAEVAAIRAGLAPGGGRAEVLIWEPFATVRRLNEIAAISLVPSKWAEPFGRTALEAHAGGAALISSGTGGLREISGEAALYLEAVTPDAIAGALTQLAGDDSKREQFARAGSERVRRLFPLVAASGSLHPGICERLDDFYERIVAHAKRRDK